MTAYSPGPNLPEDVELYGSLNDFMAWREDRSGSCKAHLPDGGILARLALAAGWIIEVPEPPTFDEVLLDVIRVVVARERSCRMTPLFSLAQAAVWDAGIAEARKRVEG